MAISRKINHASAALRSAFGRLLVCGLLACLLATSVPTSGYALPAPATGGETLDIDQNNFDFEGTADGNYAIDSMAGSGYNQSNIQVNEIRADEFTCNADGSAEGRLFVNPQCETLAAGNGLGVFANVVCRLQSLFGIMLALVYCSTIAAIAPAVAALMTLFTIIYGVMVTLGMVPHTFKEAIMRVFKLTLVTLIALNADVAVNVAYKFYISFAQTSASVVFSVLDSDIAVDSPSLEASTRAGFIQPLSNTDATRELTTGDQWMANIDRVTNQMIGSLIDGGVPLIMVMVILFFFMPTMFMLVLYLFFSVLKAFINAVIGYLLALLGITFLFTLAPIFACFALFRFSSSWFNSWLRYLASFTLQMMIVFTFIVMMLMVDLFTFFQQLGDLVRDYPYAINLGMFFVPLPIYSLCRIERVGDPFGLNSDADIQFYQFDPTGSSTVIRNGVPTQSFMSNTPATGPYDGFPRCVESYSFDEVLRATSDPAARCPEELGSSNAECAAELGTLRTWMEGLSDLEREGLSVDEFFIKYVKDIVDKANTDLVIPIGELMHMGDYVGFILIRLLAVCVLSYLMNQFLQSVPGFASELTDLRGTARLGGGVDTRRTPGLQEMGDFGGIDTGLARFKDVAFDKSYGIAPVRLARGIGAGLGGAGFGMARRTMTNASEFGARKDVRKQLGQSEEILQRQREGIRTSNKRHDLVGDVKKPSYKTDRKRPTAHGREKPPTRPKR